MAIIAMLRDRLVVISSVRPSYEDRSKYRTVVGTIHARELILK